MEQKYFLKNCSGWSIWDVHLMYDLIHCYDVLHLCSVFPFTSDRDHSVHEFLFMPTFSDEMRQWIKRARPPREKWRGTWRRNLRMSGFSGLFLFQLPRSPTSQEVMFLTIQVKGPTQEFKKLTTQCWLKMKRAWSLSRQTNPSINQSRQVQRPIVRTTSQSSQLPLLHVSQSKESWFLNSLSY